MAERGRPKVLDEQKTEFLCGMVSWGCPRRTAAKYVGISESTLYRATRQDKALAERLRQAEMAAEMEPLRRMQEHSRRSWRATAWLLERQKPNRYARRMPQTMLLSEVTLLFSHVLTFVTEEIQSEPDRQRVLKRLKVLSNELNGSNEARPRVRRAIKNTSGRTQGAARLPNAPREETG